MTAILTFQGDTRTPEKRIKLVDIFTTHLESVDAATVAKRLHVSTSDAMRILEAACRSGLVEPLPGRNIGFWLWLTAEGKALWHERNWERTFGKERMQWQ